MTIIISENHFGLSILSKHNKAFSQKNSRWHSPASGLELSSKESSTSFYLRYSSGGFLIIKFQYVCFPNHSNIA